MKAIEHLFGNWQRLTAGVILEETDSFKERLGKEAVKENSDRTTVLPGSLYSYLRLCSLRNEIRGFTLFPELAQSVHQTNE